MTTAAYIINAEQQGNGRWKFTVRLRGRIHTFTKSLSTWASKAAAIRAGRREFRV